MSATIAARRATLADLARTPGKAELINGEIVPAMPTGHRPNVIAGRIFRKLAEYADTIGTGVAYTDNMGFAVDELPSGRESFSPDAAFYAGPLPADGMRFVPGAPTFAVEVRSAGNFGPAEELALAEKRSDYFQAGTRAVWDVDPLANEVRLFVDPTDVPVVVFRPGERAHAEPAVPGWTVDVAWLLG